MYMKCVSVSLLLFVCTHYYLSHTIVSTCYLTIGKTKSTGMKSTKEYIYYSVYIHYSEFRMKAKREEGAKMTTKQKKRKRKRNE